MNETPLNIVFASHTWMGSTFVVGSHHLSMQLAAMGHKVLHVSTPVTVAHVLRVFSANCRGRFGAWFHGGHVRRNGVVDYVPMSVFAWPMIKWFVRAGRNPSLITLPGIGRVTRRLEFDRVDVLIVDQPRFVGMERILKPDFLIYRPTDLYAEMMGDADVDAAERTLAHRADALVATSGPVLCRLRELEPAKPCLLLENGVEYDHFSKLAPNDNADGGQQSAPVVYVGALDERFDFGAIEALARGLPGVQILLIGPATDVVRRQLAASRNIILAGSRPYSALPPILQRASVGVLPLSDHPANAGRSPMKLYEYAAAGLPVVARSTPELERRREPFVHLYDHTNELVSLVAGLLRNPVEKSWVQSLAKRHSWSAKAEVLLKFIRDARELLPRSASKFNR